MLTKIFDRKKALMAVVAVIVLAVCVTLFAACDDKPADGNDVKVTSITLSQSELTLEVGGEHTLTATVLPDDATDKSVTWTSSAPAIATVQNGKVTAVAAGSAVITAKAGDKSATCAVTVTAASDGLAGKTFVLEKVEGQVDGEDMDEQTKAQYFDMNKGMSFEFNADGTMTEKVESQMEGMPNIVMHGTYVLDGNNVTITPTDATINGQPQDVSTMPALGTVTFDGTYLVIASDSGHGITVKLFFKVAQD